MTSQTRNRWLLWLGLAVVGVGGSVAYSQTRKQDTTFFNAKVETGDVVSIVQATGTINAVTSVVVGSQVSGNIDKLYADFNSQVKKGQVIARIEPSLFQARTDQAKADLDNSTASEKSAEVQVEVQRADIAAQRANIEKARAAALQAEQDWKRATDLGKQGIVAQSQVDAAQATLDSAKAGVSSAQAQLDQSQAKLKSMVAQVDQAKAGMNQKKAALDASKVDLEHTVIYAPINGTVVARSVDVGQTVAASMQAPTLFTIAEDLSKMLVYAKTDESDVGNVKVGASATFKVDAFPKDDFRGSVKEIRMNPTTVQNVVTYDTVIEFANPDLKLLPGMTAYVTIPVSRATNKEKVPNGAIRFRPDIPDDERKALLEKVGINPNAGGGGGQNRGIAASGDKSSDKSGDKAGDDKNAEAKSSDGKGPDAKGGEGKSGGPPMNADARGGEGGRRGGGPGGGGRRGGGDSGGASAASVRPRRSDNEVHVIWKLTGDKQMEPVQVRTGITDYTFTAVLEVLKGTLKDGDSVITGMSIPTRASTGQFGPGGQPGRGGPGGGGFGGPGGGGRGR